MGTVYLAEDQSVGQQVAIKIVRTEGDDLVDLLNKKEAIERFRQEARAIATLDHLHILPLYRYDEEVVRNNVRAYMVMQYRPEGSLWDWLKKRAGQLLGEQSQISDPGPTASLPAGLPTNWPLSVTEVANYLQQASSALQYAHNHGIIHRDVKPANFLLRFDSNHATNTTSAFLLLSDFGLAKFFSTGSATSHVLGTPMYMAPEQFYSSVVPESDQYALAVMVYYMLAGRPPFTGDPARMMHQHLTAVPPPIRTLAPDLALGVEAVLNRALAKRIEDRYPSIEAFSEDFLQRINTVRPRPLTLGGSPSRAATILASATPAEMSPTKLPEPQSRPDQGAPSPIPTAIASNRVGLPPTLFVPTPSNPTPLAQAVPSLPQSWYQDATIEQTGLAPNPVGPVELRQAIPTAPDPRLFPNTNKYKVSRRGAVGCIVGGIVAAAIGAGVGTGIYIYANGQLTPPASQSQNPPNTPQSQPTTQAAVAVRYTLSGHDDEVHSISWSPTGTSLASGSLDGSVRIWDIATQQTIQTYTNHEDGVDAVAWGRNAQSQLIASGGKDNSVRVWDSITGRDKANSPHDLDNEVSALAWAVNDGNIFAGTLGAGLFEVSVNRKRPTPIINTGNEIDTIALSPDGRYLAIGLQSGQVTIYLLQNGRSIYNDRRTGSIFGLAWSSNSALLAIGGGDQRVDILNITTRSIVNSKVTQSGVNSLSWESGNTGRLAMAQEDNTISIWNTTNNTLISGTGHTRAVRAVAWGGRYLASASADNNVIIWNV
jgi:serine/threonine-protein kinase